MNITFRLYRIRVLTKVMLAAVSLLLMLVTLASANQTGWESLKNGSAFVMMRHALAPGTGDPEHFSINDCDTQRNLSETGRQQARDTGELFKVNGIYEAEVWSSAWCRCRETAKLLALDEVQYLEPLNSFFGRQDQRQPQTDALKDWLQDRTRDKPLVLVTHQVNISALTGIYPRSGELIFVELRENGEVRVVDRAMIE